MPKTNKSFTRREFTPEEDKKIRGFYKNYNINTCNNQFNLTTLGATLDRNPSSIRARARLIGIDVDKEKLTGKGHRRHRKYIIEPKTGCWITTQITQATAANINETINGKSVSAIRYFYEKEIGNIPNGRKLKNTCGNIKCLNPRHSAPMTQVEINRNLSNIKLSPSKAEKIRNLRNKGWKLQRIADKFMIDQSTVSIIASGKRWNTGGENVAV